MIALIETCDRYCRELPPTPVTASLVAIVVGFLLTLVGFCFYKASGR